MISGTITIDKLKDGVRRITGNIETSKETVSAGVVAGSQIPAQTPGWVRRTKEWTETIRIDSEPGAQHVTYHSQCAFVIEETQE